LFEAADQLSGSLEMARVVVDSVKLNPAVPKKATEESWVVATDLAEALSRAGVSFHRAHRIVGQLVLESIKRGRQPADWTPAQLAEFAPEFGDAMARLLDPAEGIKSRDIPGGTGPAAVGRALVDARARLLQMRV